MLFGVGGLFMEKNLHNNLGLRVAMIQHILETPEQCMFGLQVWDGKTYLPKSCPLSTIYWSICQYC